MSRDELVFRFAMLTIAVERATSVQFWQAFAGNDLARLREADVYTAVDKRVWAVQTGMKRELHKLAEELWPHD